MNQRKGESGLSVLHVVLSLNPGGAERSVIDIVTRLAPRMPTAICCLEEPGAWAANLTTLGIPVCALHRRAGFHPSLAAEIAKIAADIGANTLHCHQYTPFVYGRLAALRLPSARVIFTEQGRLSDAPPSRKRWVVNQLLGRLPARIFSVSADLRRHMIAEGFPPGRVGVIYNAIAPGDAPTAFDRMRARAELGVSEQALLVGTAARLDPVKDLPNLVEAVHLLRSHEPRAELAIIGEGPERKAIEERIEGHGMSAVVHCVGYRPDVRQLLPALDIYVNCSVSEGISLTILEAMASRLPVVATNVGGNPEVVVEGETGLLVPARNAQGLGDALRALASAATQRQSMGEAGRKRLEAVFSVDAMVERYVSAYRGEP